MLHHFCHSALKHGFFVYVNEKWTEYKHLSSVIVDQIWLLFSWLETAIQISEIVCWLQATVYATDCTDGLSRCVRSGLSGGNQFSVIVRAHVLTLFHQLRPGLDRTGSVGHWPSGEAAWRSVKCTRWVADQMCWNYLQSRSYCYNQWNQWQAQPAWTWSRKERV